MQIKNNDKSVYAEKRKAKNRRRKKRRAAVFAISFSVLCLCALLLLSVTVFFPVKNITVSGNSLYTSEEIIEAAGVNTGDKLFAVSGIKAQRQVTKSLPYVKTLKLKRKLFDSIELQITETANVFLYSCGGKYISADKDNKALAYYDEPPTDTSLVIIGQEVEATPGNIIDIEDGLSELINMLYTTVSAEGIRIETIDVSNTNSIIMRIEGRFSVNFGTETDIESKCHHLTAMITGINQKNGPESTGRIDMSAWSNIKREGYYEETGNY